MDMDDSDDDFLLACSIQSEFEETLSKPTKTATVSSSLKKQDTWIASSFGDFGDFGSTALKKPSRSQPAAAVTRKRGKNNPGADHADTAAFRKKVSGGRNDELWADRHKPQSQAELAVHKKKIQELQDWLQHSLIRKHKQAPVLLLTGPSGAGKTATLLVLGAEMGIEVQEWINPTTDSYDADTWRANRSDYTPVGGSMYVSQTDLFKDFLLRANRYPSLQIFNQHQLQRKLILVEDFPNVFFRHTSQFHDIIRDYQHRGQCPLVFIVSDSAGGDSNERLLFPKQVQADLCIANISFNPVAPTSLSKVLTRIATTEVAKGSTRLRVPNKSTIDALATASSGDIRGAINALQFACLKDTADLDELLSRTQPPPFKKSSSRSSQTSSKRSAPSTSRKQSSKKRSADVDSDLAAIGGRDTSLFLFRALGKILYCKRGDPSEYSDLATLPRHLEHHYRDPLAIHPEDILDKSQLSGEFFTAYLHQNYLDFYSQLDDVVQASEYLSDADYISTEWASRLVLRNYSASVAARAIMFCNSTRATSSGNAPSGLGWKPLHKPHCFTAAKKCRNNKETARSLFRAMYSTPEDLHTSILPYLALVNVPLRNPGQFSFLQEIRKFEGKSVDRGASDRLDEKDVALEDSDNDSSQASLQVAPAADDPDEMISSSQQQVAAPAEEEEEFVIEEFDD